MATNQAIRAGRAFVELFTDDSKLVRGLRAAAKKLKAFGASIRNLGLEMAGLGSAELVAGGLARHNDPQERSLKLPVSLRGHRPWTSIVKFTFPRPSRGRRLGLRPVT